MLAREKRQALLVYGRIQAVKIFIEAKAHNSTAIMLPAPRRPCRGSDPRGSRNPVNSSSFVRLRRNAFAGVTAFPVYCETIKNES
jgi:hypothetical protein